MTFIRRLCGCGNPEPTLHCDYYTVDANGRHTFQELPTSDLPPKEGGGKTIVRFIALSDTHETHHLLTHPESIPAGDVLLHCGDILLSDRFTASPLSRLRMKGFFTWLNELPHPVKIVIAGNHDKEFHKCNTQMIKKLASPAIYAVNEILEIPLPSSAVGTKNVLLRCLASPWSAGSSPNQAFQEAPSLESLFNLAAVMGSVKQNKDPLLSTPSIDVVMTHQGHANEILRNVLKTAKPALHFGGHNHELHGARRIGSVSSFNVCMLKGTFRSERLQNVTVVDYEL